ncbi:alpha/beta fold hydrolase [Ferrimonas sediminicola]|uniref:Alpha/beta fold hydrolase n=1 Tax=Ferrimonas sediminicola TaxID=2569538 RepID=A0A4U1B8A6_9GAMM|nr:alpha/beta fold hydrolase [Ferrimonas sediminicola]TKB46809.1 alpha/beta fold hydrolase [Ferrimonas sediminicola]
MQTELRPLTTAAGYEIASNWFIPDSAPQATLILAPAMGATQGFYRPLVHWLVGQGLRVITFDYHGVGASRQAPLQHCHVNIVDWGRNDCAAVINAAYRHDQSHPLIWLGHSLGGQLPGMIPNVHLLDRIITVASGSGYWRESPPRLKRKVWMLWYLAAPLTTNLVGYFPGRRLNMVGDLPAGVMRQWRRWCLHPNYAVGVEGEPLRAGFQSVRCPITAISFEDDELISPVNVEKLHLDYRSAPVTLVHLSRKECGGRMGHWGFFHPKQETRLWRDLLRSELHPYPRRLAAG